MNSEIIYIDCDNYSWYYDIPEKGIPSIIEQINLEN